MRVVVGQQQAQSPALCLYRYHQMPHCLPQLCPAPHQGALLACTLYFILLFCITAISSTRLCLPPPKGAEPTSSSGGPCSHSDPQVTLLAAPARGSSSLAELARLREENLVLWAIEQPCWHVLGLFPTIPVLPAVKSSGQRYLDISCASYVACTFPNNFNSWGVLGKNFRKSLKISKSLCSRTGQFADLQLTFSRGSVWLLAV